MNAGIQGAPAAFTGETTFRTNVETGTVSTDYPFKRATLFDVGGGVRIWRNLGIGVSVSYLTRRTKWKSPPRCRIRSSSTNSEP